MVCLRLDELRHRLIPLYSYDPAEEQEWGDEEDDNEDKELNVSERNNSSMRSKEYNFNIDIQKRNDILFFVPGTFIQGRKAVALRCLWNLSPSNA